MGINSFAELQSEIRNNKRKQATSIIRQMEREQEVNRRHYPIKTDTSGMRVRTHNDSNMILDTKTESRSLTKTRKR